ncbi:MAG: hypothetical protein U1E05_19490 [Patescibacteria group bacterium]|nr:hypothetical protein [Patescibacteria group bacterium]
MTAVAAVREGSARLAQVGLAALELTVSAGKRQTPEAGHPYAAPLETEQLAPQMRPRSGPRHGEHEYNFSRGDWADAGEAVTMPIPGIMEAVANGVFDAR